MDLLATVERDTKWNFTDSRLPIESDFVSKNKMNELVEVGEKFHEFCWNWKTSRKISRNVNDFMVEISGFSPTRNSHLFFVYKFGKTKCCGKTFRAVESSWLFNLKIYHVLRSLKYQHLIKTSEKLENVFQSFSDCSELDLKKSTRLIAMKM